jgi:excisionase family DNA binding protein|tara:strand:- start:19770 stop:20036 length:267 start_codon:yes stop_codon:yes gene_type:complete
MEITVKLTDESITQLAQKMLEINKNAVKQPEIKEVSKEYYTTKEAADLLKVSKQTIQNHILKGLLKASKPGKSYIISKKQLEDYVNNN